MADPGGGQWSDGLAELEAEADAAAIEAEANRVYLGPCTYHITPKMTYNVNNTQ